MIDGFLRERSCWLPGTPARDLAIVAALLGGIAVAAGACVPPEIEGSGPTGSGGSGPTGSGGSGPTGGGGSDGGTSTGCMRITYPPPPPDIVEGASPGDIVVAVRAIDLGDGRTDPPGFDLDFTCTCFEEAGDTCATTLEAPRCDGPGGVDSAASALFRLIVDNLGAGSFGSDHFSTGAEMGQWSLLLRISDYSLGPDDPDVGVALFVSPGFEGITPLWDGTDAWPISEDSVGPIGDTTDPRYMSKGAYVSGGVLVAALPSVAIRLSGSSSTITLRTTGAVLTGKLVVEPLGTRIVDGIIAGRWSESDVFASLSSFRGQGVVTHLCTGDVAYGFVKPPACSARDILTDPVQPASAPCDAISLGIGFSADPAKLGPVVPQPAPTPVCEPGQDPIDDSCN